MIVSHHLNKNERQIALEAVFVQPVPAILWEIVHNMNCHPSVTVIDSSGRQVEGDVQYLTMNELTISFSGRFSGKAILR